MTAEDIGYILSACKEKTNLICPLDKIDYIVISKLERKFTDVKSWRFNFDMDMELLFCYAVREAYPGEVARLAEGEYETYDGHDYVYLRDENGNKLADVYDFEAIAVIAPRPVEG